MERICIYLFPAIMDLVLSLSIFVCSVRAAKEFQLDAVYVGGMLASWGLAYMVGCTIVGRLMNRRNSGRLLVCSCLCGILLTGAFTIIKSVIGMYAGMILMGLVAALFFAPFQIFMAAVDEGGDKPLPYSTGMYTFSWSMGFAAGPFVAGLFSTLGARLDQGISNAVFDTIRRGGEIFYGAEGVKGWQLSYLFCILMLVCNTIGVLYLMRHAHAESGEETGTDAEGKAGSAGIDYAKQKNFAWAALIGAGVGIFSIQLIRGVFPKYSDPDVLALSEASQSIIFFLLSLVQALVGLCLCRSRTWMYKSLPVVSVGIFGVVGLFCFGLGSTTPVFIVGAISYGIYSGAFFFYFVFHAIAHPEKASKQVGTNEALVGVTGIIAPIIGGFIADKTSISVPFIVCAALVAMVLVFQFIVHRDGFCET